MEKGQSLQQMVLEQLDIHRQKNESRQSLYISQKITQSRL